MGTIKRSWKGKWVVKGLGNERIVLYIRYSRVVLCMHLCMYVVGMLWTDRWVVNGVGCEYQRIGKHDGYTCEANKISK